MLSASSATIRSADVCSLRPPLEEFPLENEIALPLRIDLFDTHEDNVAVYRFLAAQLAGRREFATYAVTLPPDGGGLVAYLRSQPALLEELFLVAEGFRVAANLARAYPGLAHEQRRLAQHILARQPADALPSQAGLLDALLLWLLAGSDQARTPPWLRSMATVVGPCVAPLASPAATADDSLAVARLLVEQLSEPGERRPQGSLGDLFLDKLTGNALLDQYIFDEAGPPAGDAGAGPPPPTTPLPTPLPEDMKLQLQPDVEDIDGMSSPLSADELQKLIEAGADLRMKQGYSNDVEGLGLYITDLLGKLPSEQLDELRQLLNDATHTGSSGGASVARAPRRRRVVLLRRVGLSHRRLPAALVPLARGRRGRRLRRVLQSHTHRVRRSDPRSAPPVPAHPAGDVPHRARPRRRRGLRPQRRGERARRSAGAPGTVVEALRGADARGARRRNAVPHRHERLHRRAAAEGRGRHRHGRR